ncbi:MAG: DUF488 family protein [Proteobacteria bacterium]|nr:DUF488 family protein [Pseudomonadota bacterium]NOG59927.1 DUF488 family protein [Pseudomonadota bacterium]
MNIRIKRIYDTYDKADGIRVLVDRLWPRGVKKSEAKITLWMKEIAPSNELRLWFDHKPEKWKVFSKSYMKELDKKTEIVARLYSLIKKDNVTLLYAARDRYCNHARVIADYLIQHDRKLEDENTL